MITTAILQGLNSPTKTTPFDTVPYQLYMMEQQHNNLPSTTNTYGCHVPQPMQPPMLTMPNNNFKFM